MERFLAAGTVDGRELGLVFVSVGLESKKTSRLVSSVTDVNLQVRKFFFLIFFSCVTRVSC